MNEQPKGLRTHIAIYGRRNVGKSSLLNAMTGQRVSIVSPTPGTTTDPVEKTMELSPLGPVVFLDTAGVDDEGSLGEQRRARTYRALDRTDIALLVTDGVWGHFELDLLENFRQRNIPFIVVLSKSDTGMKPTLPEQLEGKEIPLVAVSSLNKDGLEVLRTTIAHVIREKEEQQRKLVGDLVPSGGLVLLVVPIDTGAPKGRLILPQVQAIRDLLDSRCLCMILTEGELPSALSRLKCPPDLVVCDSQVVHAVADQTPPSIPLTTFSILMARFKGDLVALVRGAATIPRLRPGDRVLIGEACSHHPSKDDIGRVKIPRWLASYAGGPLKIDMAAGKEFVELENYSLIVHCGGCVITRGHMLQRIGQAHIAGIPITNYGVAISLVQGVLERTLAPFPEALEAFHEAMVRSMTN